MKLKNYAFLLFFSALSVCNSALAGAKLPAKITCQFQHAKEAKSLYFRVINDIIQESETITEFNISKQQSNAIFQLDIENPTVVRLTYDTRSIECYVEPGNQITITADALAFPELIRFEGDGLAHNQYLHKAFLLTQKSSNKLIRQKMYNGKSMEFKAFVDKLTKQKWDFYRQYDAAEIAKFSPQFTNYAAANIDYWRAVQLMTYREEHENSLLNRNSTDIPDEYYTFLDETLINNDDAICNAYYRHFLRQYGSYRLSNPNLRHGLAARQLTFKVHAPHVILYESIDLIKPIAVLHQNERYIISDKMAYEVEDERTPIAYRLRVQTTDGLNGWVRPVGITLEKNNEINQNALFIEHFEVSKNKKYTEGTITLDSVKLFADQNDKMNEYSGQLASNEKVMVLNEVTTENISYLDLKAKMMYTAPYQKVRTSNGKIGWITSLGLKKLQKQERITENKSEIEAVCHSIYENIDYFFVGKAKYYLAAYMVAEGYKHGAGARLKPLYSIFRKENNISQLQENLEQILIENENKKSYPVKEEEDRRRISRQSVALNLAPPAFRLPYASSVLSSAATSVEEESRVIANERKKRGFSNKKNINEYKPQNLTVAKIPTQKYELKRAEIYQKGKNGILSSANFYAQNSLLLDQSIHLTPTLQKDKTLGGQKYGWVLDIVEPMMGIIYANRDSFEVFVEQGDAIEIETIHKNDRDYTIASGKGSLHFRYLQTSKRIFKTIEQDLILEKALDKSPADFIAFMNDAKLQKEDFYDKFPHHDKFSWAFDDFVKAEINYWHAYHLLSFPVTQEKRTGKTIELPDNYYDFLKTLKHPEYAICSKEYRKFIELYQVLQARNNKEGGRIFDNINMHPRAVQYRQAQRVISELSSGFLDNKKIDNMQNYLNNNRYAANNEFLAATYHSKLVREENTFAPDFELWNADKKYDKLSNHRGKVIYVIFWKSSDTNLENAQKTIKQLEKDFAKRNIEFMWINLDDTESEWQNALKRNKMKGIQLFHRNANFYEAPVEMTYNIQKTTVALLINEQGKVAKTANPILNDNTMLQKMDELLNK